MILCLLPKANWISGTANLHNNNNNNNNNNSGGGGGDDDDDDDDDSGRPAIPLLTQFYI